MTSWTELESEHPDLCAVARERFDGFVHKILGTVRADGRPRLSGTEVVFAGDHLWLGSMPASRKEADLDRDPRCSLHSGSADPNPDDHTDWVGDAKLSGRAVRVTDPAEQAAYLAALQVIHPDLEESEAPAPESISVFRIGIEELTTIVIGDPADHLLITTWTATGGIREIRR